MNSGIKPSHPQGTQSCNFHKDKQVSLVHLVTENAAAVLLGFQWIRSYNTVWGRAQVGLPASIKHSPATNKVTEVYLGEKNFSRSRSVFTQRSIWNDAILRIKKKIKNKKSLAAHGKENKVLPFEKKKYIPAGWKKRGIMKGMKSSCIVSSMVLYSAGKYRIRERDEA